MLYTLWAHTETYLVLVLTAFMLHMELLMLHSHPWMFVGDTFEADKCFQISDEDDNKFLQNLFYILAVVHIYHIFIKARTSGIAFHEKDNKKHQVVSLVFKVTFLYFLYFINQTFHIAISSLNSYVNCNLQYSVPSLEAGTTLLHHRPILCITSRGSMEYPDSEKKSLLCSGPSVPQKRSIK